MLWGCMSLGVEYGLGSFLVVFWSMFCLEILKVHDRMINAALPVETIAALCFECVASLEG